MDLGPKDKAWWDEGNAEIVATQLGYIADVPFTRALGEFKTTQVDSASLTDFLLVLAEPFFKVYEPPLARVVKK